MKKKTTIFFLGRPILNLFLLPCFGYWLCVQTLTGLNTCRQMFIDFDATSTCRSCDRFHENLNTQYRRTLLPSGRLHKGVKMCVKPISDDEAAAFFFVLNENV